jgi:hypothetical protein
MTHNRRVRRHEKVAIFRVRGGSLMSNGANIIDGGCQIGMHAWRRITAEPEQQWLAHDHRAVPSYQNPRRSQIRPHTSPLNIE